MEVKLFIEQLVGVTGDDHEHFLLRIKNRFDRVGLELPTIEVRAEGLVVETEAYACRSPATPTVFSSMVNTVLDLVNVLHLLPNTWKTKYTILHETNAIIKPHRMTLLLGSAGSGKSTLLKALAGKLDPRLQVLGRVTYNGHRMEEFVPERTAAYISQEDLHAGEMTVRETLAFAARCLGTGDRHDLLAELTRREKEANITPEHDIDMFMKESANGGESNMVINYVMQIIGLHTCADTLVGSDMARGISGGQKKRVTIGELLISPARALFMDEISTGLDSSTAFQIMNFLRQMVHILGETALISLLQPSQEIYDLFDDIILLSEGHVVYQGPKEKVVDLFESLGFICPHRKAIADFLLEVTSRKDQQQYWSRVDEPYQYFTVQQFSKAFHDQLTIRKVLGVPFVRNLSSLSALKTSKYGVTKRELAKAIFAREICLLRRNPSIYIVNCVHLTMLSLITMMVFWHKNMRHDSVDAGGIYLGVLFFCVSETMFSNMCDLGTTVMKLPLFFKQRDVFYPAWAYTFPTWILKIPITLIQVTIWVTVTYYPIGFDQNIGRFVKHYFLLLALSQMSSSLFRLIAGATRNMFAAKIFGTFTVLILLLLSGFILSSKNLNKFWMLGYWISPLMYAQNAISTNEFTAHSWSKVLPGSSDSLGASVLKSRGLFLETKWYWIGLGALVGYTFLFNCLYTVALACFKSPGRTFVSGSEKAQLDKKHEESSINAPSIKFHQQRVVNESRNSVNRRVTLPFVPLSLTFDNIRYSVDIPKETNVLGGTKDRLEILKGVSGAFRPSMLTALMGCSGAGKTTLMDVLAGRKTGGYIEGTVHISGYPKKQETFSRVFGYCEQSNIHSPHLTVLESLLFSAWLRLPSEIDSLTRKMFVEDVMELLELTSLQDAHVGLAEVNGLSNEQRRRLTIAVELVANPSIIFMDEPTSGLDARGAAIVMRTVRNLVNTGKTIVCTIHQPSIDIFETFDEGIECVNRIKDGHNPATWMLEVTSTVQEQMLGVDFSEIYKRSELYQRNKALVEDLSRAPASSSDLLFPKKFPQALLKQCLICLWKQNLLYWRNIHYIGGRFFVTTVIALLFGTVFWNLGMKRTKAQDLFNSMGSIYSSVLMLGVQNASGIQPVVTMERIVFYRERASGMYSPIPYAIAQVAIELPYVFVQTLIYGVLVYTMMGFEWTVAKFFWYLFFMYFTLLYFTFFGMTTVGFTPNAGIAAILSNAIYGFWNLFSGFLIPVYRIPIWWRWYYWICPVAWTLYGLGASQFGDVEGKLDTGETVAEFMRSYYGFKHEYLEVIATATMACSVAFAFLFGFSLKYINFQKR
ncbi:ABC transporter G family member 37-like isoform X2 [Oryza brachyantha]|uniref:ABC transporter G family member 37-like isoform X2 n=1 Tax=Oryza brachyantha TaxID=4533 RepID=UPI001ADADD8D|nr:ABC transporter G family member 37-like isoform X2 [Oryza brachyantha]